MEFFAHRWHNFPMLKHLNYSLVSLDNLSDGQVAEVKSIIECELEYKGAHSFDVDFYPLFNRANFANCHAIIKDGGEIIGHVGVKFRQLQFKDHSLGCALIGGVAIKKSHQGMGYFSSAFSKILEMHRDKTALFMLWGKHTELYAKHDFYEVGTQLQLGERPLDAGAPTNGLVPMDLTKLDDAQKKQIQRLYKEHFNEHYLSFTRTEEHWREIECVTSAQLYATPHSPLIESYFFCGKGQDLDGVIHEQVNLPLDELADYRVWLPESYQELFPGAGQIYAAFVKIGNEELLGRFLSQISKGELSITQFDRKNLKIQFNFQGEYFEESTHEFLCMLFGPFPLREFEHFMPKLFLCGLDSI